MLLFGPVNYFTTLFNLAPFDVGLSQNYGWLERALTILVRVFGFELDEAAVRLVWPAGRLGLLEERNRVFNGDSYSCSNFHICIVHLLYLLS